MQLRFVGFFIASLLLLPGSSAFAQSDLSLFVDLPENWEEAPDQISLPDAWYQQMVEAAQRTKELHVEQSGCLYTGALPTENEQRLPHVFWVEDFITDDEDREGVEKVANLVDAFDHIRYRQLANNLSYSATVPYDIEAEAFRVSSACRQTFGWLGSFHTHPSFADVIGLSDGDLKLQNIMMSNGATSVAMVTASPGFPVLMALKTKAFSFDRTERETDADYWRMYFNLAGNLKKLNLALMAGTDSLENLARHEYFNDYQNFAKYVLRTYQEEAGNEFVYYIGYNNELLKLGSEKSPWPKSYVGEIAEELTVPEWYVKPGNLFAQLLSPFADVGYEESSSNFQVAIDEMLAKLSWQAQVGYVESTELVRNLL